uniref:CCHC-type domain-containing protein n=1 Tax=Haemonchus contortus TaxID=6289 RepID=A0A7I4YZB1_HAECO
MDRSSLPTTSKAPRPTTASTTQRHVRPSVSSSSAFGPPPSLVPGHPPSVSGQLPSVPGRSSSAVASSSSVPGRSSSVTGPSSSTSAQDHDSLLSLAIAEVQGMSLRESSSQVGYRQMFHPQDMDPSQPDIARRPSRRPTPQELILEYSRGNFEIPDISSAHDDASQDRSLPPAERMSLRIAQSLTIAANADRTFSIDQLATRDLVMVDAFLRHSFYNIIRDAIVEETAMLTEADLDYPRGEQYPIYLLIQAFKGLHAANKKLQLLTNDLAKHPEYWRAADKPTQLFDEYLTLYYNVQNHRNTLMDLIVPQVLNPIEDTRRFVDILSYYSITLADIKLLCTTASAVTATTALNLKRINSAIARLHGIDILQSSVQAPEIEEIATVRDTASSPVDLSSSVTTSTQTTFKSSAASTQTGETSRKPRLARTLSQIWRTSASPTPVPSTSARTPSPEYSERSSSPRRSPHHHRAPVRLEEHHRQLSPESSGSRHYVPEHRRQPSPSFSESRQYVPQHRRSPSPSSSGSRRSVLARRRQPSPSPSGTRQSVPVDRSHIRCCFCRQNHYSADCNVVTELSDRALRAVNEGRCLICLHLHSPGFCRRDAECRFCASKKHHPAVCPRSLYVERDFDMDYNTFFKDMYDLYLDYYRRNTRD